MSSEHSLWERIRKAVGTVGDWQRIEFNPEAGVPDVNFCISGIDGWLELKFTDAPPIRPTTRVFGNEGLRKAQEDWIRRRIRNQGRVFICSQIGRRLILTPGVYGDRFNDMTLVELIETASWHHEGGTKARDWVLFIKALVAKNWKPEATVSRKVIEI